MPKRLEKKDQYRIALLGDLREGSLRRSQIVIRKISKGLIRNGHDVQVFSYYQQLQALVSLPRKSLPKKFGKKKPTSFIVSFLRTINLTWFW